VARDPEHSLEIELPFLQRALGHDGAFTLIPLMLRDQGRALAEALGRALAGVLRGRRALLVASSDLSHFYPQPLAQELDGYLLQRIAAYDPVGVLEAEEHGRGFACGKGAIAAVLWAAGALGARHAAVVKHATSGDVNGDYSSVVGYGAAVIWK
jgi:AmmeMemoRadiSam system protein B